jgi:hypothetical protein
MPKQKKVEIKEVKKSTKKTKEVEKKPTKSKSVEKKPTITKKTKEVEKKPTKSKSVEKKPTIAKKDTTETIKGRKSVKNETTEKVVKKRATKPKKDEVPKKKRVPKPPRIKRKWGKIVRISPESLDFLIGREVRILPKSNNSVIYAIVRWPGYEGIPYSFSPNEIEEIEKPTYLVASVKEPLEVGITEDDE